MKMKGNKLTKCGFSIIKREMIKKYYNIYNNAA